MIKIIDAGAADVPTIQNIAEKTWWPAYSKIISKEQIRYMLDTIYDSQAIIESMSNGSQHYILLNANSVSQGFASYGRRKEDPTVYKLQKLYVLPENHGLGYGRLLIDEVKRRLIGENIRILDLNVNRYNSAKSFYEKLGFSVIAQEDVPIGPYWMNDFVMRLRF
jgi:ribosomal protein S18 acetylase RimI-like enzyme